MVTLNTYTGNTFFVTLTSDHLMYLNFACFDMQIINFDEHFAFCVTNDYYTHILTLYRTQLGNC